MISRLKNNDLRAVQQLLLSYSLCVTTVKNSVSPLSDEHPVFFLPHGIALTFRPKLEESMLGDSSLLSETKLLVVIAPVWKSIVGKETIPILMSKDTTVVEALNAVVDKVREMTTDKRLVERYCRGKKRP